MKRWIVLAASACLAGCSGDASVERDNSGELAAEGEVLGGSISDAMIPVETVRSQSRTLRAAPEPGENQDVEELFDVVVTGEGAGSDSAAASEGQSPAAQPAPPAEPAS